MIFVLNSNRDFTELHNSNSISIGDTIISNSDNVGYCLDLHRFLSNEDREKGYTAMIVHTLEVISYYPSTSEYLVKSSITNDVARIKATKGFKHYPDNRPFTYSVAY